MLRNRKKLIGLGAAVLCMTLIISSWAYYSSATAIDNELKTNSYGNRTVEEFTPSQEIEPGMEIIKTVGVTNTGDYDLVVRIKMTEKWDRGGSEFIGHDSADVAFHSVTRGGTAPDYTYTANQYDFTGTGSGPTDGMVDDGSNKDDSVMYKTLDMTNWIDGGDGYWYYNALLGAGLNTGSLLESVVFADNADMGSYISQTYYSIVAKDDATLVAAQSAYDAAAAAYATSPTEANKAVLDAAQADLDAAYAWTITKPADESTITFIKSENDINSANGGYANADYTLTIITEVCQATEEAVDATWVADPVPAIVKTTWGW